MSPYPTRRGFGLAAAGALCLAAAGIAARPAASAPASQITIDRFAFSPATLTVSAGSEVVWVNRDGTPHTIAAADPGGTFKSGALDTGDKFAFVFAKPGSYKYFCTIHPQMVGTIVVK